MRRQESSATSRGSPLQQARNRRNWTQDDVIAHIDARSPDGASGVTRSQYSRWEQGRIRTSAHYRRVLCEIFEAPPEELFAHQDQEPGVLGSGRILVGHRTLLEAMTSLVTSATSCLVITGSRSRDLVYLDAVETALAERQELIHYRILFGPPHHQVLKDHLTRLLSIRDPRDRSQGVQTLHLGVVEDPVLPERFFCATDAGAVVVIPSLTSAFGYDSGVEVGPDVAARLIEHGKQAYAAARRIETCDDVAGLPVLRR